MKRALAALLLLSSLAAPARAAVSIPAAPADAGAGSEAESATCVERVPGGKAHPSLSESLPQAGTSGHVVTLTVTVEHGKGETVLPGGFRFGLSEEGARALEHHGFFLPDPDGGAGPNIVRETAGERVKTRVFIPLLALPEKPGRNQLTLPPLPVTVARASGEVVTLCTKPHSVVIEDPIANTPHPEPHRNPAARPEFEVWTAARNAVFVAFVALVALLAGALIAWFVIRWLRSHKPLPPPLPPRPPWEVALEELFDIKNAGYIREQRFAEYFDRVSDTVRTYLGARYGFDGLECTTRETLGLLRRIQPPVPVLYDIESFLRQADLVKFARLSPTEAECEIALERGEHIVHQTIPAQPVPNLVPPPIPPAAAAPPQEGSLSSPPDARSP